jgi:hypothetical protein
MMAQEKTEKKERRRRIRMTTISASEMILKMLIFMTIHSKLTHRGFPVKSAAWAEGPRQAPTR